MIAFEICTLALIKFEIIQSYSIIFVLGVFFIVIFYFLYGTDEINFKN